MRTRLLFAVLIIAIDLLYSSTSYAAATDYCKDKLKDRDKDYISDCDEVRKTKTNPTKKDTDKDKIADGDEDNNKNGIANEDEDDKAKDALKRKSNLDDDKDCLQNEDENEWGLSAKVSDTDGDGVLDGLEDSDNDGVLNKDEDDRVGEAASLEDSACGSVPVIPTVVPTQVAAPTAIPIPPSIPDSELNFDAAGNVTARGKIAFKIPSTFDANLLRGREAHISFTCSGCHVERGGYDFEQLKTGTDQAPMNTFGLDDQILADLAAWLNRGRVR